MFSRKGQSVPVGSNAATLVLIIAGFIVLYILFLSPVDRAQLLGEPIPGETGSSGDKVKDYVITNKTLFSSSPGKIDYSRLDEYEYDLPAFTLFKTTDAQQLESFSPFSVRDGWFDSKSKNISFFIKDIDNIDNVMLSFDAKERIGDLIIRLNGDEIYNYPVTKMNPEPLSLTKDNLVEGENNLVFEVSPVGMRFWTTNEYDLENIQVLADITDISRQEARNTFYISTEEGERVDRALLKFNPECNIASVGLLDITLNGRSIFSGVPDCGVLNTIYISPSYLNIGNNNVVFRTEKGSYLVDQIMVKTELKEPVQPAYSFELAKAMFSVYDEDEAKCGEIDNFCPDDCDEDMDRDCCFEEYRNGYWCDMKTQNFDDRCVGYVEEYNCARCKSGYEDKSGDPPEDCEDICGDDTDDQCPIGCDERYDKDCCFDLKGEQYWCEDLPITGIDFTCKNSVSKAECESCPKGYDGEDSDPSCPAAAEEEGEEELKSKYDIDLKFTFDGGDEKEALVYINGKETRLETYSNKWDINIDDYVRSGSNTVRLVPKSVLYISRIEVTAED